MTRPPIQSYIYILADLCMYINLQIVNSSVVIQRVVGREGRAKQGFTKSEILCI